MSAQASKEIKEPLFRITKRGSITAGKAWAIRGLAASRRITHRRTADFTVGTQSI